MILFIVAPIWFAVTMICFFALFVRPLRCFAFPLGMASLLSLPFGYAALLTVLFGLSDWRSPVGLTSAVLGAVFLGTLAFVGGVIGALLGFGAGLAINRWFGWTVSLEWAFRLLPSGRQIGWLPRSHNL